MRNQPAFTLLEMMISLLLTALTLTAFLQYYVNQQKQYQREIKKIHQIATAEKLLTILTRAIRMRGFVGCAKLKNGFEVQGEGVSSLSVQNQLASNKQSQIRITHMDENYTHADIISNSSLLIKHNKKFNLQNSVVVADCKAGELAVIHSVKQQRDGMQLLELSRPLFNEYANGAYLGEWITYEFFLEPITNGSQQLWLRKNQQQKTLLASDIVALDFSFTLNNRDLLFSEVQVHDWAVIQGVKITLKMCIEHEIKTWNAYVALD